MGAMMGVVGNQSHNLFFLSWNIMPLSIYHFRLLSLVTYTRFCKQERRLIMKKET